MSRIRNFVKYIFNFEHHRFVYASSGKSIYYSNWYSGEPNSYQGKNEDCVEIRPSFGWKWNDEPCSMAREFACQKCKFSFDFLMTSSNEANRHF